MVSRVRLGGGLRELVAVAGKVGEADHLVALVVVPQHNRLRAQLGAGRTDPRVHRLVRLHQVVVQRTRLAHSLHRGLVK